MKNIRFRVRRFVWQTRRMNGNDQCVPDTTKGVAHANLNVICTHALVVTLLLWGCSAMQEARFQIKGVDYAFPPDHVEAIVGPGGGRVYARLAPPGAPFVLVA